MKTTQTTMCAAAGALALVVSSANAAILAMDDFNYADGPLVGQGTAGDGWAGAWTNIFGNSSRITVTSGVVSGEANPSHRNIRQLDPTVAALTFGDPANDGTTIYVGIDWEIGVRYGGIELTSSTLSGNDTFRLQLGAQATGPDLRTGNTIHVPAAAFDPLEGVSRYVMAITYDSVAGDMVELFRDGVSIGTSTPNASNNFSFDRVGFGVFVDTNPGTIPHADNLIIATTFAEANGTAAAPPRIIAFSYNPADGSAEVAIQGAPNTRYKLVEAADLDFSNPDQDPMLLLGATVGTLAGGVNVITDENGEATVQLNLGTGPATFIRAEETGSIILASYDFEAGGQGFTPTGDWAWGTPASDNGVPGGQVAGGSGGSTGAWATVLGDGGEPVNGGITPSAESILRSPDIDLTGITGARLAFAAAVDSASGDTLEVLVRDAADDALLGTITPFETIVPATAAWQDLGPYKLPEDAANKTIYLEFRFVGTNADYLGFYLDDVTISY